MISLFLEPDDGDNDKRITVCPRIFSRLKNKFSSSTDSLSYESGNDIRGVLAFTLRCGSVGLAALRS